MKTLQQYLLEGKNCIKSIDDLNKFLEQFPDDATSWRNAGGEIQDICRTLREYAEEYDGIKLEAVNFRSIKKPSEWNKKAKEFINTNINKLSKHTLDYFLKDINDMFCEE